MLAYGIKFLLVWIVAILILAAVVSCAAPVPQNDTNIQTLHDSIDGRVIRYIDSGAGVACWVFYGTYKGGISCLPISSTLLK